jgi:hypothetical protein
MPSLEEMKKYNVFKYGLMQKMDGASDPKYESF